MSRHITRKLTPSERARSRRAQAAFKRDMPGILAAGRQAFDRHERLHRTVQALKAERQAQQVSLAELARRTKISKSALSRLENDPTPNPTIHTLGRIADALGKVIDVVVRDARRAA